ncbi:MAG: TLC domain-containing protein [Bacteroidota bacterium]
MTIPSKKYNNPFTPIGFRVFLRRDVPIMAIVMLLCIFLFFLFCHQTCLVAPAAKQLAWANREVAILHAFFVSTISLLLVTDTISAVAWQLMLNVTRGFLLSDTVLMLLYPTVTSNIWLDVTHHVILFWITLYAYKGQKNMALGLIAEITLVPLYFSWYMLKWSMQGSTLFIIVAIITLLSYFFLRIGVFSYLLVKLWKQYINQENGIGILQLIIFFPIILMNYLWFYRLLQHAFRFLL